MNQAKLNWFFFLPENAVDESTNEANFIYGVEKLPDNKSLVVFYGLIEWMGRDRFVLVRKPQYDQSKIVWRQTLEEAKLDAGDKLIK